jgi:hypothetical protein
VKPFADSANNSDDIERVEALKSLDRIDRVLDKGGLPGWLECVSLVAAARWALENGFPEPSELEGLAQIG